MPRKQERSRTAPARKPASPPAGRVTIIAEIGMNHDGSFGNACRMIDAAAECGADAAKFQLHIASAETLRNAPTPPYFSAEPRYEYFERTSFRTEQWKAIRRRCTEKKVAFYCSPFSDEAVEALEKIGMDAYKIPSGEVTNLPFLETVASTGKPVLLSSGMSTWAELDRAVETILRRHDRLTVLQCTSEYPCPPEHVGLNNLDEIRRRYKVAVGLSDHTLTSYASLAAVVLGAAVIEKHFTLSRKMYGSDAAHSLEPADFAELVSGIRTVEKLLASPVDKDRFAGGLTRIKQTFEKSVVTVADIPAGARIEAAMLGVKKPALGIPAARLGEMIGRHARRAIKKDCLLREEDLK